MPSVSISPIKSRMRGFRLLPPEIRTDSKNFPCSEDFRTCRNRTHIAENPSLHLASSRISRKKLEIRSEPGPNAILADQPKGHPGISRDLPGCFLRIRFNRRRKREPPPVCRKKVTPQALPAYDAVPHPQQNPARRPRARNARRDPVAETSTAA